MRALILIPLFAAAPLAAAPTPYPHKPGVTLDAFAADETACRADAVAAMRDPAFRPTWAPPPSNFPAASAAGAALASGFAAGLESGKRFKTTLHDCFVAKGYQWLRPTREDDRAARKLKAEARQNAMLAWIAAPAPPPGHLPAPRDEFD